MFDRTGQCWFFDNLSPHSGGSDSILLFLEYFDDVCGKSRWRCLRTLPDGRILINFFHEMNPLEKDQSWDRVDDRVM